MLPTPEESGPPTHKLVNELSSKQCKNGDETAEGGQSYVDKGIDIIHQKEKLPSSSEQVTTDTNERTGTINIPNEPLHILKNITPPKVGHWLIFESKWVSFFAPARPSKSQ